MSYPVYTVPAGDTLPVLFDTFDGGTGASITMTGLAVTDVEIYKDGSATQRSSDSGVALLDTDGIDFDGITGIHGFSIDTSDDDDSGFYAVGSWYHVVVSAITVDGQTVNFIACAFRIMAAESVAGVPKVDVSHIEGSDATDTLGTAQSGDAYARLGAPAGASVSADVAAVKAQVAAIETDTQDIQSRLPAALTGGGNIKADVLAISGDAAAADNAETAFDGGSYNVGGGGVVAASVTGAVGSVTGNVGGNVTGSVGSLATQAKADVNAEVDGAIETYHLDHLLAATYDPSSKPGAADALLNELVENDGGVARFTENALEQAPSGTGGDATEAKQDTIIGLLGTPAADVSADIAAVKSQTAAIETDTQDIQSRLPAALVSGRMSSDAVAISGSTTAADNVEANIGNLDAAISGIGGATGSGADNVTITLTDDDTDDPIADADVWVSTDADGDNVVAGTLQTDSNGQVTFLLDDTNTYYLWAQKDGWKGIRGTQFVASAD